MGADIGTEDKNFVVISEDMTEWSENVILAYNNPLSPFFIFTTFNSYDF